MTKLIYKGYVYESGLKITTEMDVIVDRVLDLITDSLLREIKPLEKRFLTNLVVTDKYGFDTMVYFYVGRDLEMNFMAGLNSRYPNAVIVVLLIPHLMMTIKNEKTLEMCREKLLHEMLHAIDPKRYDSDISNKLKSTEISVFSAGYRNQPLELDQFLSSKAKIVIDRFVKEKLTKDQMKKEIQTNFQKYFSELHEELQIEKNRKLFSKLLYYYIDVL